MERRARKGSGENPVLKEKPVQRVLKERRGIRVKRAHPERKVQGVQKENPGTPRSKK
jgi:hypothetical protein